MERMLKKIFALTLLTSSLAYANGNTCFPSPTVAFRSQGMNSVMKLVGLANHTHLYDMDCWWGTFAVTPLYEQSFRGRRIAECLFGSAVSCNNVCCPTGTTSTSFNCNTNCNTSCNTNCNTNCCDDNSNRRCILIQGSQVTNRNPGAWLADNFYLPTDFESSICFEPRIKNFLLWLDLYVGLDEWVCGMYFRVYGPINWTKWELRFCENVCNAGTNSHEAGYFGPEGVERNNLLADFTAYAGGAVPSINGVTPQGLQRALINNCNQSKTGFADLWLELGWDFLRDCDYHLGVGILAGAPTGSKREACRVFDPVVGNGNHWQLGGVVTAHWIWWRSCEEDKHFGFYLDANILHLFSAREQRTFDLCGKPNSRYMLAERLAAPVTNNLAGRETAGAGAGTAATSQFQNVFTPVANLTTFDSKVSVGVQADITAMFNFTSCGISWDFGYNFWGRSCERIDCDFCNSNCNFSNLCDGSQDNMWALKGDARVYGFAFEDNQASGIVAGQPIALSATQSQATICSALNEASTTSANDNPSIDNARFAVAGNNGIVGLVHRPFLTPLTGNQVRTSIQPLFINCEDIKRQETRGISHKLFTHLSYTWDCECWTPYLGVGGSAEFGKGSDCCPSNCGTTCGTTTCGTTSTTNVCNTTCNVNGCDNCTDCALSQWAIWIKGGVSFN